jgi:acyl-coenzyme A synthetase/AMP-(fatty) acid ligase
MLPDLERSNVLPAPPKTLADYRQLRASFHLECPRHFNFGYDVVDRWAGERPDALAILWVNHDGSEQRVTFRRIAERSNQVANALAGMGLQRGDQVLIDLPSIIPWWESMVGLTKAGMIAIPGTTLLTEKDIAYRVKAAEVDAVVTDSSGAEKVDHIIRELPGLKLKILVGDQRRPGWTEYEQLLGSASSEMQPVETARDEPSLIYFTSGTTGMPKMVMHSHASYGRGHYLTARFWLGLTRDDLHWNLSDTGWAKTAYSGLFGPWIAGSTIFVRHHVGKFDPLDVLRCLSTYEITSFWAPPTVYRMLVQQDLAGFRPRALQHCMAAGEPLNAAVLNSWRGATGLTIREGYGQTETVILCANIPDLPVKPGSMGLPPPGIELAVIDDDGNRLPTGETGEIAVCVEPQRPLGLYKEYWHNPEATAKCFRDGWYRTGDCAYMDDDGYFWFVARADDIITSAAYRIGPFEVESALMEHPAVAEVAVIGKPDPERTEIVRAFVVLAKGFAPSEALKVELQDHTRRATAPYKYPREIEFMDELPKTPSGKIRRVQLRKML